MKQEILKKDYFAEDMTYISIAESGLKFVDKKLNFTDEYIEAVTSDERFINALLSNENFIKNIKSIVGGNN